VPGARGLRDADVGGIDDVEERRARDVAAEVVEE
jgi:hypothetical protein